MKAIVVIVLIVLVIKFFIWVWPYLTAFLLCVLVVFLTSLVSLIVAFIVWHTCAALFGKTKPGSIANTSYERWGWFVTLASLGAALWLYVIFESNYYTYILPRIIAGAAVLGVLPVVVDVIFTRKKYKVASPAIRINDKSTYSLTADGRIVKRAPVCAMSDLDIDLDITANLSNGSRRRS